MSYPPQQPPGGPYGPRPQSGGGPYGGQQPSGQQPGGQYGQYGPPPGYQPGQYGGFGGQTPKQSPLPWILGGGGALVVVLILVGGFGWPGFFSGGDTSTPEGTMKALAKAFNDKNADEVKSLVCASRQADIDKAMRRLDPTQELPPQYKNIRVEATFVNVTDKTDTSATGHAKISYRNVPSQLQKYVRDQDISLQMEKEDGAWKACPSSLTSSAPDALDSGSSESRAGGPTPGATEQPSPPGGSANIDPYDVFRRFTTAINTGDGATLDQLICSSARSAQQWLIEQAVADKVTVSVAGSLTGSADTFRGTVNGTMNGALRPYTVLLEKSNGTWCIADFTAEE